MDDTTPRRRAPGMSPERRREMIIAAAIPLIAEHGAALTTSKVARAVGIGEATIFRVFADKDELLDACRAEVLNPATVLDSIASIPLDQPLDDRLLEAITAMEAHVGRIGDVLGALATTEARGRSRPSPDAAAGGRRHSIQALVGAVAALFEPDAAALRLPPTELAGLFVGQMFYRRRPVTDETLPNERIVDLFLHGAITGEAA